MTSTKPRRAAIYARTNLDPRSVFECRRIQKQIELCLSIAESQGFTEDELHVYKDEGLSGVATAAPGLEKLLAAVSDYESVFVPDPSRISRCGDRAAHVINQITASGATLWACDPIQKISPSSRSELTFVHLVRACVLELERERRSDAARRGHAKRRKAKQAEISTHSINDPNQIKGN